MTREGFNTGWLWKQWNREVTAARLAIAEGRYAEAETLLATADKTAHELTSVEREAAAQREGALYAAPEDHQSI